MTWQNRVFHEFERLAVGGLIVMMAALLLVLLIGAAKHPVYLFSFVALGLSWWLWRIIID